MDHSSGGATVEDHGDTWVLWGEIDVAVAQRVGDELKSSLDGRPKTIDLRRVTFLDSSGLRLLLLGGSAEHGPLLVGAPTAVREIVALTGLEHAVRFAEPDGPAPHGGDA
ncbi:STAS domain-containing protein [Isoptericola sp. NPDC019482]|uniref:STAS domain-containing protein n=1 Tax=Isoptericola sp. NPDC019482 TaxID=3154688 RepID=UPI0034806886